MKNLNNNRKLNNKIHIKRFIKSEEKVWGSFLNYEKRFKKEKIEFNKYIKNKSFINTTKYLYNNSKIMLLYLWHYGKMSNLLYGKYTNKLCLFSKNLLYITIFGFLFVLSSFILLVNDGIKSILRFLLNITELILAPIIYKHFILHSDKDNIKIGDEDKLVLYNIDLKYNRHFKNLKEYYKCKFNQIIGIGNYQIYPLKSIKQKIKDINNSNNLSIIKYITTVILKILNKIQLISLKFILSNFINNIKNTVIKINENIQIKYIRNIVKEQIRNINQNNSRTSMQVRNNIENELRIQINNNQIKNKLNLISLFKIQ